MVLKSKKCKICQNEYTPARVLQQVCSPTCALALARLRGAKKSIKAPPKVKTLTEHLKDAQAVFNRWIRLRDGSFCISCQQPVTTQIHAGHYRTTKAASQLRFNEDNCHSQCVKCNNYLSGNIILYRQALVKKVGIGKVEELESNNEVHRYSIEEAKAIRADYTARIKECKGDQ